MSGFIQELEELILKAGELDEKYAMLLRRMRSPMERQLRFQEKMHSILEKEAKKRGAKRAN